MAFMTYYVYQPDTEDGEDEGYRNEWFGEVFELRGGSVSKGDYDMRKCSDYSTFSMCYNPGFVKITKEEAIEKMYEQISSISEKRKVITFSIHEAEKDVDYE